MLLDAATAAQPESQNADQGGDSGAAEAAQGLTPKERAMRAIRAGRIGGLEGDGEEPPADEPEPEPEPAAELAGADQPVEPEPDEAVESIIEKVRKAREAKAAAPPAQQDTPAPQPAPPPVPSGISVDDLRAKLTGPGALDYLAEQGIDAIQLYERLTDQANTPAKQRALSTEAKTLADRLDRLEEMIRSDRETAAATAKTEANEAVLRKGRDFIAENADKFPFLAAETDHEQNQRMLEAASELVDVGIPGTYAQICELANDGIRKKLGRYPGVKLGEAGTRDSVVGTEGAESGGSGSKTLSASMSAETPITDDKPLPLRGTREWKAHWARRAGVLMDRQQS